MVESRVVPVTAYDQNCTIWYDTDSFEGVVIDPGGDVERVLEVADELGVRLVAVWLTHGHVDHAGGAMDMQEALAGVDILGPHEADAWLLGGLEEKAGGLGMPNVRNCRPSRFLGDGEVLHIGRHPVEVLHLPGHSPGHVVFHAPERRMVQVGDLIVRGGLGRSDLPGGNPAELVASVRERLLPLGDDVVFICGHGDGGKLGAERAWIEKL